MKLEFKRFELEKFSSMVIGFQFLGASGLLAGFYYKPILIISSLGLTLLMLLGVMVRIRMRDSLLVSFPAFFYMCLNGYIFWISIH
tara:strand:- start:491 stop:748 length:258 start_codon:yes stop_codon:yes gene_type:complete